MKGKEKYLNPKTVSTIDPVTGWLKITQYYDKYAISMMDLVETT